jgi:hypothetical protein
VRNLSALMVVSGDSSGAFSADTTLARESLTEDVVSASLRASF